MSLPKIANALEPRAIPEHKMWFNPLAPAPEEAANAAPASVSKEADRKPEEQPATHGAPLKEAEAILPRPELPRPEVPKVVVIVSEQSLSNQPSEPVGPDAHHL